jgi:AcrR family transcriptional regulator
MSERMERRKEARRNQILDVAEKMVVDRGIDGMTMDDVAREVDVATGTLYLYYKNKNSLCAAVSVRLQKRVNAIVLERVPLYRKGAEQARAAAVTVIEFAQANPDWWKAIKALRALDFDDTEDMNVAELLALDDQMIQLLTQCYRDGIALGELRPDLDPVAAAIFLRQAAMDSFDPTPRMKAMLRLHGIDREHWLDATRDMIVMATHLKKPHPKSLDLRTRIAAQPPNEKHQ